MHLLYYEDKLFCNYVIINMIMCTIDLFCGFVYHCSLIYEWVTNNRIL